MTQKNLISRSKKPFLVPLILLVVCVLAYGILIPTLGYYWDDWPYAWINHMYGPGGYPEYVALDRPYSAWIFMAQAFLFGEEPLGYHFSSLLLYWLCAVLFWRLIRLIWPTHPEQALWAALLFSIYPGFLGHPQAIIYNHHFSAMALYLFSFIGMVRAVNAPRGKGFPWTQFAWHLPALAALVISQFSIEYFVGWEAARWLIVWVAIKEKDIDAEHRVGWSILHTLPYWLMTLIFLSWRIFIFQFPTYQPIGGSETDIVLGNWLSGILEQLNETVFSAWKRALPQLSSGEYGVVFWVVYLAVTALSMLSVFILLSLYRRKNHSPEKPAASRIAKFGGSALNISLVGLVFAGWPFWLTDLTINIHSPFNSRFTMAFVPWITLFMTAILHALTRVRWGWVKVARSLLLAVIVGGSTGWHLWNANFYRNEWLITQRYFQQMVHRIPDLTPGTSLVINDLRALSLYQDDSLTAILNWTYAPENTNREIDYIVQYLSVRLGREIPALEAGLPIDQTIRSVHFSGNTDQMIVVYYQPPGCLRVLDYEHPDRLPEDFPQRMLSALPLSNPSLIIADTDERASPPLHLFEELNSETWCLYFEEADLAAQQGDWERVAALGDRAFRLEDQTNEPTELFVFIEGYLRLGSMGQALDVSGYLSGRSANLYDQAICGLWQEVESEIPGGYDPAFDTTPVYGRFCSSE